MSLVGSGSTRAAAVLTPAVPASEIARLIESDILFGRLRPRERLVEDVLMERFAATRHSVRRALTELERSGIVVLTPNRGASVRDFTTTEVEEITELRETLHRRAIKRMSLPLSPSLISEIKTIQRRHDRAIAAQDPWAIDKANEAFHGRIFAACGNKLLSDAIGHYAYLSRAMRLYPLVDPKLLQTLRSEHWAMIDALECGDRCELTRLVVGHIKHSKALYLALRGTVPLARA